MSTTSLTTPPGMSATDPVATTSAYVTLLTLRGDSDWKPEPLPPPSGHNKAPANQSQPSNKHSPWTCPGCDFPGSARARRPSGAGKSSPCSTGSAEQVRRSAPCQSQSRNRTCEWNKRDGRRINPRVNICGSIFMESSGRSLQSPILW